MSQFSRTIIAAVAMTGIAVGVMAFASPAKAESCDQYCFNRNSVAQEFSARRHHHRRHHYRGNFGANGNAVAGTSAACARWLPYTCGCELSIRIFGRVVNSPNLKLASTWAYVFPRTSAAPGMVAARSGHTFQLISHVSGNVWLVWDPNSGGNRVHVHQRSIAGYAIVNPHGGRFASL